MQTPDPNFKRKNISPLRVIVNQWGCLMGVIMLALGGVIGLLGAIFVGPQLLGFDLTATALVEREILLEATRVDLDARAQEAQSAATSFALDAQGTQAIINNDIDLLMQTATQSAQNIRATNTASAVQNVQRQTQIANDFAATQSALNANATQVELDFRNTQAALGVDINRTQSDTSVISAATPLPRYSIDMSQFEESLDLWQVSSFADWQVENGGLIPQSDSAWFLEATPRIVQTLDVTAGYTLEFTIRPAPSQSADYWFLFGLGDDSGLAAYFSATTLTVTEVGIYRFDRSSLDAGSLEQDALSVIQRGASEFVLDGRSRFTITVDGASVTLGINDTDLLEVNELEVPSGALGAQLPPGATLFTIVVSD